MPLAAAVAATIACGSKTGLLVDDIVTSTGKPNSPVDGGGVVSVDTDSGMMMNNVPCMNGMFTLTPAQSAVMFVIDRSGSMGFGIDGQPATASNPSRWDQLSKALSPVVTSIESSVQLGAKVFPDPTDPNDFTLGAGCGVADPIDVQPGLNNAQPILSIFQTSVPGGGTPTGAAISASAQALTASASRAVTRFMVLATDGAPNCNPVGKDINSCVCTLQAPTQCNDPQLMGEGPYDCLDDTATIAAIRDAYNTQKIPTFVIGIGEQEKPEYTTTLDAMAVAGGRPQLGSPHYYKVLVPDDLTQAFTQIQQSITQCTFVTPSVPTNPDAISITLNGIPIMLDPTHMNGWDYVDKSFGEIQLFGAACDTVQKMMGGTVSATVDCTK
jgi:hypothetical protein